MITSGYHLLQNFDALGSFGIFYSADIGYALFLSTSQIVKGCAFRLHMGKISPVEIRYSQFTENIIQYRSSIFDAIIALHHTGWLKFGEGKRINKFIKRYPVLQTNRYGDSKVVHHRTEPCALFVHINKNLTQLAIFIFARAEIYFMPPNNCFLSIASATLRHFLTVTPNYLFDNNFFNDLLSQDGCFFLCRSTCQNFLGLLIVFYQRCCQRL